MKAKLILSMLVLAVSALSAQGQQGLEETTYLPKFERSKSEIETLEENLAKTGELADILKRGNDELSEAIKQYHQDQSPETKNRVYALLGDLARQTVTQIEGIVAHKDQMQDGVAQIIYKMKNIQHNLIEKKQTFTAQIEQTQQKAGTLKTQLKALARKIKRDTENMGLRKEFRTLLFKLKNLDHRYKTYRAHERLNAKFTQQVGLAHNFFEQLNNNTDQLIANLQEQKEFLVMKVGLLRDAAEMESWLRGEGQSNASAFAMMKKIGELSQVFEKFNAATDILVEMNDIGTLIDSLPDASQIFGIDGKVKKGERLEDKYIDYFLEH
jgi:hypothetical protein